MKEEIVKGTSLWKDAWKRLLKNKLAVFGLVVTILMTLTCFLGPFIWQAISGNTPEYIPSNVQNGELVKSFPPSWSHPLGTDDSGRDLFFENYAGWKNFADGRDNFNYRFADCGSKLRSNRRLSRRKD